jgi:hypothetical protein
MHLLLPFLVVTEVAFSRINCVDKRVYGYRVAMLVATIVLLWVFWACRNCDVHGSFMLQ